MDNVERLKRQRPWLFIASAVGIAAALGVSRLFTVAQAVPIGLYIILWLAAISLVGLVIYLGYTQAIKNAARLNYFQDLLAFSNADAASEDVLAKATETTTDLFQLRPIAYQPVYHGVPQDVHMFGDSELYPQELDCVETLMSDASERGKSIVHLIHDLAPEQQETLNTLEGEVFAFIPYPWEAEQRGTLCLVGADSNDLRIEEGQRYLASVGEQIANALEKSPSARSRTRIPTRTDDYFEICNTISKERDFRQALSTLVTWMEEYTFAARADGVGIMLVHPETKSFHISAGSGLMASWNDAESIELPLNEKAFFDAGEILLVNDVQDASPDAPIDVAVAIGLDFAGMLAAPLISSQEGAFGAIVCANESLEKEFTEDDEAQLLTLADRVSIVLENSQRYSLEESRLTDLDRMASFKSSLVYNISHELRTSLASLKAATGMLLESEAIQPGSENYNRLLQSIARNVSRQESLVTNVVDMASLENESLSLNVENVDIDSFVAETTSLVAPLMSQGKQSLSVSAPSDLPTLVADRQRLSQIMVNLLTNAQKYSPEGSEISLEVESDGKQMKFTVSDSGEGIAEEEREHVFEAFYRVQDENTVGIPGSGLGLAITKSLVELHSGSIWVEEGPMGGAAFIVSLPVEGKQQS